MWKYEFRPERTKNQHVAVDPEGPLYCYPDKFCAEERVKFGNNSVLSFSFQVVETPEGRRFKTIGHSALGLALCLQSAGLTYSDRLPA
jgi:hypothetical protein